MLSSRSTRTQLKKVESELNNVPLQSVSELERLLENELRKSVTSHVLSVYAVIQLAESNWVVTGTARITCRKDKKLRV
jgi:hypothetical protein